MGLFLSNCKQERGGDSSFVLSRQKVNFGIKGFNGEIQPLAAKFNGE